MSENDLYDRLTEFIKSTNAAQTETIKAEIQSEVQKVKKEVAEVRKAVEEESKKREELERKQTKQEETNEIVERTLKKNNIIVWNLEYDDSVNLPELVISTLNSALGLSLTLALCNNINPMGKGDAPRPIIVRFVSFLTKSEVLKECKKLKNSNISISEDLTIEERRIRRVLVKHKKTAIEKGNKAHIRGVYLYVNGERYSEEALEEQEPAAEVNEQENITNKSSSAPATPTPLRANKNTYNSSGEEDEEEVFNYTPVLEHPTLQNIKKTEITRPVTRKSNKDKEDTRKEETKRVEKKPAKVVTSKSPAKPTQPKAKK